MSITTVSFCIEDGIPSRVNLFHGYTDEVIFLVQSIRCI